MQTAATQEMRVLSCDGSALYPHLQIREPSNQSYADQYRSMTIQNGLPLQDLDVWQQFNFTSAGLRSIQPSSWLNQDAINLFSALDAQTSDQVSYISCQTYSLYQNAIINGD